MDKKKLYKIGIFLNFIIVAMEIWAISKGVEQRGMGDFIYYTELSNLYGGIACLVCGIYGLKHVNDLSGLPRPLLILKYTACASLIMTFLVVIFILAPMMSSNYIDGLMLLLTQKELPITHAAGPLLVAITYIFFEGDCHMTFKQSFVGIIPTMLYALVAYPCNFLEVWNGPYPFLKVNTMPPFMSIIWFFALFALIVAICQIPRLLTRRFNLFKDAE